MPLPSDTSLSLLGYSRPGDTLQSKPKRAMLVRLSSEALDALESFSSHPQVQFEFGENPGLYVGEEHFPMRHSSENTIHELFLRASSASKKSAPLKLHANVVGKFAVERELADQLRNKIRESTIDAANQRNSRSTVLIDTPPDLQTNPRKRKEPPASMFRKPIRPSDKLKPPAPTSGQYAMNQSPSTLPSKDSINAARKRIIQYLALNNEATEEKLSQIANFSDRNLSFNQHLTEILDQVETTAVKGKSTDGSAKRYQLKPVAWKEVRPFEWSGLTEPEQARIARQARIVFQRTLRIPESDPIWEHVRYKNTPTTEGTLSTDPRRGLTPVVPPEEKARSRGQDAPKRGISSRDAKEKRPKQRSETKGEILMKDESSGTTAIHKAALQNEKVHNGPESRRIPDAYLASGRTQVSLAPKPTRTTSSQIDKDSGKSSSSKSKVGQSRQTEKTAPSNSSRVPLVSAQDDSSSKSKKGWRDEDRSTLDSERVKRSQPESSKGVGNGVRDHVKSASVKRKMAEDELYDSSVVSNPTKRPRSDYSESPASKKEEMARDISMGKKETGQLDRHPLKKAQASSSLKSRKTRDSPPPPPPPLKRQTISMSREPARATTETSSSSKSHTTHASGSQGTKLAGSTKPRRRSPIYTSSSEDDGAPPSGHPAGAALTSTLNKNGPSHLGNHNSKALPTDHMALRARYRSIYLEYLSVFQLLLIEKGKNDALLNNDLAGGGIDSDGDGDLMDPDELAKLTTKYKELRDELERIQILFGRTSSELTADLLP